MRKVIILLTVICLMFSGCSNKKDTDKDTKISTYTFKGENELWNVELNINAEETFTEKKGTLSYENNVSKVLTATYQKDLSELSSTKNLMISYKSSVSGGTLEENYEDAQPTERVFTLSSASSGGAIESADEIIEVNIAIDGTTQTIELKNEN
ncbi:hypothetical protein [Anaerocolumna sp. MB42-C2]|uniref:hypothetical protein n=1 Tax=Anaerocolumna sp. MB42-C2 TaxID=3070997 RepID=UPI0027DFEFC3|nr:hypothetical protein [Anaerocolumna sp. MB42-C2]WMJ88560.1 hypothetical protein RBU59_03330 [Anaerocolumna sp. MB42-C2]